MTAFNVRTVNVLYTVMIQITYSISLYYINNVWIFTSVVIDKTQKNNTFSALF